MSKKVFLLIGMLASAIHFAEATPKWNVTINNHSGYDIQVGPILDSACWWTDPTSFGGNDFWQQKSLVSNGSGVWSSKEMDFSVGGDCTMPSFYPSTHRLNVNVDSQDIGLYAYYTRFAGSGPVDDWLWYIRLNVNTILAERFIPINVISHAPVANWEMPSSVGLTIDYYGKNVRPTVTFTSCEFPSTTQCTIN